MNLVVLAALVGSLQGGDTAAPPTGQGDTIQTAGICFHDTDYQDGMNRICIYDCLSGKVAITIKSIQLCPLTIRD